MRGGAKVTIEPHRHEGKGICIVLYHAVYFSLMHDAQPTVLWHCWLGVRKRWVLAWLSIWVWCKWFAYGPAYATPHHLLLP